MRGRATARCGWVLAAVVATTLSAPAAPTAYAQESAAPTLAGADVTVGMVDDAVDTVSSHFRLAAPTGGETDIPILLLERTGVEVLEVTGGAGVAAIDAPAVDDRLSVTLAPGTREFVLDHTVLRTAGTRAVPLLVPEIDTDRQAQVRITVQLPDGQRLVGDSMPTFAAVSTAGGEGGGEEGAVTVQHTGGALPSVVVADYGTSGRITVGTVLSVLGIGLLVLVCVLWFRHSARAEAVEA
jgi:hypothetical protein